MVENIVAKRAISHQPILEQIFLGADKLRLDDLYKMTAHIYGDRNSTRPKEATFAHFVEVCGMLTVYDRGKRKEGFDLTDALCKALGWYFPLLAKMRVRSVEQLIFRKYPLVCPYCRKCPHDDFDCKQVRGTDATVNHRAVIDAFNANWDRRPSSLNEWQRMFAAIYPRQPQSGSRSVVALMEELGELGEAVRVFDIHPEYFLGEAADTFTYIMGLATEHQMREAQHDREFSFEDEYLARYPGLCIQCGSQVCVCPAVPSATIGRMAKELRIDEGEQPFITDLARFDKDGIAAAHAALEQAGGYPSIASRLPFDRGDANHALVYLCLNIADAVEKTNDELAVSLRREAVRIGGTPSVPGSPRGKLDMSELLDNLRSEWRKLSEEDREKIKSAGGLVEGLGDILGVVRVLLITSNSPTGSGYLNLAEEQRAIRQAIKSSNKSSKIALDELPAARSNDFRTTLLRQPVDVIHFSGHADSKNLVFVGDDGNEEYVEISAFAQTIAQYPIKCVILNACEAVQDLAEPISPITIGMDETIDDDAAIAFSRGFYDALANGHDFARAFEEGKSSVRLSGFGDELIKMIVRPSK